jgi:hypothetical protein
MLGFEGGDSDSADRFPVVLKSRSGRNLPLCTSTQYAESRACATAVGQLLQFEIEDASSDHPTRIAPTHADLSLQERVRLERTREEHAERPAAVRSEVTEQGGVVRIVIPMPRLHPVLLAVMLIPVGIALIAVAPLAQFFRQTQTPAPVSRVFLGFLGFAFVLLPATSALSAFLRSRWGRTIVTVTTEGIRIEQRGAVRTKTIASFTVSEVVDVDFSTTLSTMDSARRAAEQRVADAGRAHVDAPVVGARTARVIAVLSRFARGRGVILKTRRSLTSFGEGLADEEVRYLHAVVRRALIGERATGR